MTVNTKNLLYVVGQLCAAARVLARLRVPERLREAKAVSSNDKPVLRKLPAAQISAPVQNTESVQLIDPSEAQSGEEKEDSRSPRLDDVYRWAEDMTQRVDELTNTVNQLIDAADDNATGGDDTGIIDTINDLRDALVSIRGIHAPMPPTSDGGITDAISSVEQLTRCIQPGGITGVGIDVVHMGDRLVLAARDPINDEIIQSVAAEGTLLWAKAKQHWVNVAGNGSYVYCNPCSDINATTVNTETDITVYLPRCAGSDPNVVTGQVIAYQAAADGSYVAVSGYLDAAIGTIRMWSPNSGDPPAGWEECSMLSGRFPRGRKLSDENYDTTGTTGGSDDGTHAHRMQMDMSYPDLTHSVEIDFGIHGTHIMTMLSEDASPPWCIVRFIERVG